MKFRIFSLFLFLASHVNLSLETIQHDRFSRERKLAQEKDFEEISKTDSEDTYSNLNLEQDFLDLPPKSESRRSFKTMKSIKNFFKDIYLMLEYNQNKYMHFIVASLFTNLILHHIIKSIIYSTFSTERNFSTREYLDPVLKFLESYYYRDYFDKFQKSRIFNRLITLILSHYLILRLRYFYLRFQDSKTNRNQYKKLNIVQLNMSYANALETNFTGLFKIIVEFSQHQCDYKSAQTIRWANSMKNLTKRLRNFKKIDKLYYFNQIDFNHCYRDHKLINLDKYNKLGDEQNNNNIIEEKFCIINFIKKTFAFRIAGARDFVSKPTDRVDPKHLVWLIIAYYLAVLLAGLIVVTSTIALSYAEFEAAGLDYNNLSGTISKVSTEYHERPGLLINLFEGYSLLVIIAINLFDNALITYSSVLAHSRSDKVKKLLLNELEFRQSKLEKFRFFLSKHEQLSTISDEYKIMESVADSNENYTNNLITSNKQPIIEEIEHSFFEYSIGYYKFDHDKQVADIRRIPKIDMLPAYEVLTRRFKTQIDKLSLKQFNHNVNYILDLIEILQLELNDMKSYFTASLNLAIIFGSIGLSIAISLLSTTRSYHELIIALNAVFVNAVPIVHALFMAASTERSVSLLNYIFHPSRLESYLILLILLLIN